jgi:histidinol dehydrogenase
LAKEAETRLREAILSIEDERRRSYLQAVFSEKGKGAIIVTPSLEEACEWINGFAPEHLMIVCSERNTGLVLEQIRNAGEILIGESTPFSAANYAIGITAVLPTNQYAKAFSGITARDMVKYSTIGKLSKEALEQLYPIIQEMGTYEHLPAHVKAADIRFSSGK